jgi:hypothetical protein
MKNEPKNLADKLKEVNEAFNTLADRMQTETIKTYFTKSEVEAIVKEQYDANQINTETYQTDENDK